MAGLLEAARKVRAAGAKGSADTVLAHITPAEAALLKRRGGSGRIDPKTGLPHFEDDTGDGEEGPGTGSEYGDPSTGTGGSSSDTGGSDSGGSDSGGSDSGGSDSGWSGGLSGSLGFGISGVGEDNEGKGGKGDKGEDGESGPARSESDDDPGRGVEYGEPDDTYSGKADPNEEDARNNYNAALGNAYRGSVEDARNAGKSDANFANTDLNDARAGGYVGALHNAAWTEETDKGAVSHSGLDAHTAAVGGVGMRGADNGTDQGATFGNGYGGRGEQNAALDRGGYSYGERAGEFGALDAALNYGPWSQTGINGLLAAATLANPFAGVIYSAIDTGGKAVAGGDVTLGDVGNVVAGGVGAGYGTLAGIGARTANDVGVKGVDATQSVATTLSSLLGGQIGGLLGSSVGGGAVNDVTTALGTQFGGIGGAYLSSEGGKSGGSGQSSGGSSDDASLSSSLGLTTSKSSSGVNAKRTTIKLN